MWALYPTKSSNLILSVQFEQDSTYLSKFRISSGYQVLQFSFVARLPLISTADLTGRRRSKLCIRFMATTTGSLMIIGFFVLYIYSQVLIILARSGRTPKYLKMSINQSRLNLKTYDTSSRRMS